MTRHLPAAAVLSLLCAITTLASCGNKDAKAPRTSKPAVAKPALGVEAPGIIAFRRYLDSAQKTSAIFTIRPDGRGERQVSHPPNGRVDDQPAISADGKRLAWEYCGQGDADPSCHVIVSDIDGGHPHEVRLHCPHGPICDVQAPAWGPDGRLVLWLAWGRLSKDHEVEHSQLIVADADGHHPRVVVDPPSYRAETQGPVWSPDGTRIAYEDRSITDGAPTSVGIAIVSSDGGRPRRVTPAPLGAGDHIDWSPDGKRIVFRNHADADGSPSDLEVVHPDGSGRRNLTRFGSSGNVALSSSFSPDGGWIVFAAQHNGASADLFVMRKDGSDLHPLTRTPLWDSAPEWGR